MTKFSTKTTSRKKERDQEVNKPHALAHAAVVIAQTTSRAKGRSSARMTEADLAAFKQKNGANRVHDPKSAAIDAATKKHSGQRSPTKPPFVPSSLPTDETQRLLQSLGVPTGRFQVGPQKIQARGVTDPALAHLLGLDVKATSQGEPSTAKPKRRGVDVGPIMASLKQPVREAIVGETAEGPTLSLWFTGARLLTVNEFFSILQTRMFEMFRYKSRWKALIQEALSTVDPNTPVPFFDGPCRLVLFRRGTKKIDLDSFQTVFKYAIDGLRKAGVLIEDDPEIVVETVPVQHVGAPAVGLRLERLLHWQRPDEIDVHEAWFHSPEPKPPKIPTVVMRRSRGRRT